VTTPTDGPAGASLRRIGALLRRHLYLLLGSWPRILDLVYWPTVQMIMWGFITKFLAAQSGYVAGAAGIFLSAVLLWDTLFRGQLGVSTAFLEEMYARHLGHLFVSPLRPYEFVAAVFSISLLRVLIGVGGAAVLAWPIHQFSLVGSLGWALIPFFAILLVFGWAIGIIIGGLVLRLGLGAENLAWAAIFFIQPLSGVYYPLETLPALMRAVGWLLPSAPVFEGMRAVLVENRFDAGLLAVALGLLAVWLLVAAVIFNLLFRDARDRGLLCKRASRLSMHHRTIRLSLAALGLLLIAAGAAAPAWAVADDRRREEVAQAAVPARAGLDPAILARTLEEAEALSPRLRSLIVAREGAPLVERVLSGPGLDRPVNIKSASKSVISALVGIAIERGVLKGVDQRVAPVLGGRVPTSADPRVREITVGHLLSMRAGLERTSGRNYGRWVSSPGLVRFALSRPFVDEPGGRMLYSTAARTSSPPR
jgi:ABC-2 type transport system permease protein